MPQNRTTYRIDLDQLRKNFNVIKKHAKSCSVMPVLKYDAYGLGSIMIGKTLAAEGACRFAAATLDEALVLKKLGKDIQILGMLPEWEIPDAVANDIICPAASFEAAEKLSAEAVRQQKKVRIAVKIDTGMSRLGIRTDSAAEEIAEIIALPGLEADSLFSHFSTAAKPDLVFASMQIERFIAVKTALDGKNIRFRYYHHAAGDASVKIPDAVNAPFNMIRPGGMMYGEDFSGECRQIVELTTSVGEIRSVRQGDSVGYFRTFIASAPLKTAVLYSGYADGIPLALSNKGRVIIRGKYCPVIGRISMDYTIVDVSALPYIRTGDEAVLLGRRGDAKITVREWGNLKETHGHDIWCSIGNRTRREYIG